MPADPKLVALERVDSLAERAYLSLREQIATGGFAPGERVTERALGLRLGVSATPIREALRRLEQERLVERVTARQLRIAAHCEASLRELMYTEAVVRAAAARFATEKISTDTLGAMEALLEELEHDPAAGDPVHQLSLARRFDELLLAATGNDVTDRQRVGVRLGLAGPGGPGDARRPRGRPGQDQGRTARSSPRCATGTPTRSRRSPERT
jgi:DNA-binding GntR family transcriptional regulator